MIEIEWGKDQKVNWSDIAELNEVTGTDLSFQDFDGNTIVLKKFPTHDIAKQAREWLIEQVSLIAEEGGGGIVIIDDFVW